MNNKVPIPTINWNINHNCNYNCSYCFVFSKNSGKNVSRRELKKYPDPRMFLNKFRRVLKGSWEFVFGGEGEPFMMPNFLEIIKELVKMRHQIGIVTNFSFPLEKNIKFCEITKGNLTFLNASLHLDQANLEDFFKKAVAIEEIIGEKLHIVSVAIPGRVRKLEKIGKTFLNREIKFAINLERDYVNDEGKQYVQYSEKELGIIKKFNGNFGEKSKLKFTGKMCWAGSKYFVLNPDGEAYRCNPAGRYKFDRSLGNILSGTFKLNKGPLICRYKYCDCVTPVTKNMIIN